jgi:hypothetical protein
MDADGLDNLQGQLDAGLRVNGLATTNTAHGPTIYLRTYDIQSWGSASDQVQIRVRVTYYDPHTGKRHGVTLGATRLADRYNPT